ncbi:MAG: cobalamin-dependent protein [bacterium]
MIFESQYLHYLSLLLEGDKKGCSQIIKSLLDEGIDVKEIYTNVIKRSMYRIGQLWELDKTTIAKEHCATKITELVINQIYPHILSIPKTGNKVIVTCADKEFHELGARMVSDIFELNGWTSTFLGANTPANELLNSIAEIQPELVAISINFYINFIRLVKEIELINERFPNQKIVVGGQAFSNGGESVLSEYQNVTYISCLYTLEDFIKTF